MYTDSLRTTLSQIVATASELCIPLFHGDLYFAKPAGSADWDSTAEGDWQAFLGVAKAVGPVVVHVEVQTNEAPEEEEAADILLYGGSLSGEARARWQEAFDTLELTRGFVSDLTLAFLYQGIRYTWQSEAAWEEHYWTVRPDDAFAALVEENEALAPEEKAASLAEQMERHTDELLRNEVYLSFQKVNDRRQVVVQTYYDDYPDRQDLFRLASKAEERFQREVQATRDRAVQEKLAELKRQAKAKGKDLTKAAACGALGLSDRELNKYWYKADV